MKILMESILAVREEELTEKTAEITEERWERIQKMHSTEDKKRSFLAGRLLHKMCVECGIHNPVYATVANGKPILLSHPELAFAISHSGELVVVAYEKNAVSVGVDVQQIKGMSVGIKRRLLHEKEKSWMEEVFSPQAVSDGEGETSMNQYLNRIWAIKEGFVKMTGEGMAHDFRNICVDMEKNTVSDEKGVHAAFTEPQAQEGYVLAVVYQGAESEKK